MSHNDMPDGPALANQWCDASRRTRLVLRGEDRLSFLHNLCTNEIKSRPSGQGCEAFITNVQGKCLGYVAVLVSDDYLLLDTVPEQGESLATHLDRYLITEDVEIEDRTETLSAIVLFGNDVENAIQQHFGRKAPASDYEHYECDSEAGTLTIARVPWSTAPSFLLLAEPPVVASIGSMLRLNSIPECSDEDLERARIQAGFPRFGQDVTVDNLPQEVDRNDVAISFTKGCYLGQETVARLDALGHVNKVLVRVHIEGPCQDSGFLDAELVADDDVAKAVGKVTSCASSGPDQTLAMAYVRCAHATSGSKLRVACHGGHCPAFVL